MIFGLPVNFDAAYADKIINNARRGLSADVEHGDLTLWFHLMAAASAICPSKNLAVMLTEELYEHQDKFEALIKLADIRRTVIDPTH
jgi:hypothetical protein